MYFLFLKNGGGEITQLLSPELPLMAISGIMALIGYAGPVEAAAQFQMTLPTVVQRSA